MVSDAEQEWRNKQTNKQKVIPGLLVVFIFQTLPPENKTSTCVVQICLLSSFFNLENSSEYLNKDQLLLAGDEGRGGSKSDVHYNRFFQPTSSFVTTSTYANITHVSRLIL